MNLEQEFVILLEKNQNILHKICKIYTDREDERKDLFQEITIQLWHSYPRFKGEAKFSTWAYRVGLNTAISLFRSKKRKLSTVPWNQTFEKISYEEYDHEKEDQLKHLYEAIYQLNDIEKALIYLYLEDKDYSEIAETLGINEVNARVKMNRTKTKLKEILKKKGAL
ncbi:sigma-70 family RNA polymerase sigma factor [Sphingobacterium sp. SRCM116780]|uniref:RNA polymerase sigma factor n=1 Tax=Sphingobacterium sp. SRCM116780 TaxID=2907623 RepID=UPI001F2F7BE6|nr:sigma-70 family RNA polymerase sigma factor [Sphingobacterium sp. SRCM116780]UIR55662.1 sigma-70 family RNA polymerase sigma factor [Sphingobacterium sp. SRCM116780]